MRNMGMELAEKVEQVEQLVIPRDLKWNRGGTGVEFFRFRVEFLAKALQAILSLALCQFQNCPLFHPKSGIFSHKVGTVSRTKGSQGYFSLQTQAPHRKHRGGGQASFYVVKWRSRWGACPIGTL